MQEEASVLRIETLIELIRKKSNARRLRVPMETHYSTIAYQIYFLFL